MDHTLAAVAAEVHLRTHNFEGELGKGVADARRFEVEKRDLAVDLAAATMEADVHSTVFEGFAEFEGFEGFEEFVVTLHPGVFAMLVHPEK